MKRDHENIIAVTDDGSPCGGEAYEGLSNAAKTYKERYLWRMPFKLETGAPLSDVGITEAHAAALASGIAVNGGKTVYGIYSL